MVAFQVSTLLWACCFLSVETAVLVSSGFSTNSLSVDSDDERIANGLSVTLTCTYELNGGETLVYVQISETDTDTSLVYDSTEAVRLLNDLDDPRADYEEDLVGASGSVNVTILSYDDSVDGPDYRCEVRAGLASGSDVSALPTIINDQPDALIVDIACDGLTMVASTTLDNSFPRPTIEWSIGGVETPCTADEYADASDGTRTCTRNFDDGDQVQIKAYLYNVASTEASCVIEIKTVSDSPSECELESWEKILIALGVCCAAVGLTCVGLYCCKKHNICCWKDNECCCKRIKCCWKDNECCCIPCCCIPCCWKDNECCCKRIICCWKKRTTPAPDAPEDTSSTNNSKQIKYSRNQAIQPKTPAQ